MSTKIPTESGSSETKNVGLCYSGEPVHDVCIEVGAREDWMIALVIMAVVFVMGALYLWALIGSVDKHRKGRR